MLTRLEVAKKADRTPVAIASVKCRARNVWCLVQIGTIPYPASSSALSALRIGFNAEGAEEDAKNAE